MCCFPELNVSSYKRCGNALEKKGDYRGDFARQFLRMGEGNIGTMCPTTTWENENDVVESNHNHSTR